MNKMRADTLQQASLVALLVVGLVLLHRFAVAEGALDPRALLAVGFVILTSRTVGEWVSRFGLPPISGYIATGLLLGPSAATWVNSIGPALPPPFDQGVITPAIRDQLLPLEGLSLALIALSAGGEIHIAALRRDLRPVLTLLGWVALLVGGSVFVLTAALLLGPGISVFSPDIEVPSLLATAGVVAAIAVGTSPAITMAVLRDTGATGPVTRRLLTTVVLSDVLVGLLFAATTALLSASLGVVGGSLTSIPIAIGGAVLAGGVLAAVLHAWMQLVRAEILLFVVGVLALGDAAANGLRFDIPITFLTAGFVLVNSSPHGEAVLREARRLSAPVFVAFFTLAGAKLDLYAIAAVLPVAVAIAGTRVVALWCATRLAARTASLEPVLARDGWLGLVSQAGLAIGLANLVMMRFPDHGLGAATYTLVLGVVALNETVGPATLLALLRRADEIPGGRSAPALETSSEPLGLSTPKWGVPLRSGSALLDAAVGTLEERLQHVLAEIRDGPFTRHLDDRHRFISRLRSGWEEAHNQFLADLELAPNNAGAHAQAATTRLTNAWKQAFRTRASSLVDTPPWRPSDVVRQLDEPTTTLPEQVDAPWPDGSLESRWESPWLFWERYLARRAARNGGARPIPLRTVARFHLSGRGPSRIEPAAALTTDLEYRLGAELADLFYDIVADWHGSAAGATSSATPAHLFDELVAATARSTGEVVLRLEHALIGIASGVRTDLWTAGLPGRGAWHFRPGRVFAARDRAVVHLGAYMTDSWQLVARSFEQHAAAFEVKAWTEARHRGLWEQSDQLATATSHIDAEANADVAACQQDLAAMEEATLGTSSLDDLGAAIDRLKPIQGRLVALAAAFERVPNVYDAAHVDSWLAGLRELVIQLPEFAPVVRRAQGDHVVPPSSPETRTTPRADALAEMDGPLRTATTTAMALLVAEAGRRTEAVRGAAEAIRVGADLASAELRRRTGAESSPPVLHAWVTEPGLLALRRLERTLSTPIAAAAIACLRGVGLSPTSAQDASDRGPSQWWTGTAQSARNTVTSGTRRTFQRVMTAFRSDPVESPVGPMGPVPESYRRLFIGLQAAPLDLVGLWPEALATLRHRQAEGPLVIIADDDALVYATVRSVLPGASWAESPPEPATLMAWSTHLQPDAVERWLIAGRILVIGRLAWAHHHRGASWGGIAPWELPAPTPQALQRLVLARHATSGRGLRWGPEAADDDRAESWFRRLHEVSGGSIRSATAIWLEGLSGTDPQSGDVVVGRPPSRAPPEPPPDSVYLLRLCLRDEGMDEATAAECLGQSHSLVEAVVAPLLLSGWLNRTRRGLTVPFGRRALLLRALDARGWA